jgi:hypothetical protein
VRPRIRRRKSRTSNERQCLTEKASVVLPSSKVRTTRTHQVESSTASTGFAPKARPPNTEDCDGEMYTWHGEHGSNSDLDDAKGRRQNGLLRESASPVLQVGLLALGPSGRVCNARPFGRANLADDLRRMRGSASSPVGRFASASCLRATRAADVILTTPGSRRVRHRLVSLRLPSVIAQGVSMTFPGMCRVDFAMKASRASASE